MKYRSRTDIIGLILEATKGGLNKTKIMYRAYLSSMQLKEYLMILLEKGLIEYEEGQKTYRTTTKGIRLLRIFNNMEELTPSLKEIRKI
jgi:predicted transcriptional regulator